MNDIQLARQLADQTDALHQAAAGCHELAGQADLYAPLLQIITDRISALVEELRWEVAAVRWADSGDDT
jgi:HPt (histidine-containing phosphotransfer) domain-containing protein